jgi:hypothetical protein
MMTEVKTSWKQQLVSVAAANLLGIALPATTAWADNPTHGLAPEIASTSAGSASDRSGRAKPPARKPMRTPDGAGNFVYGLINTIRAQSEELCARYGNPSDCLEEAEVCLTMRDTGDNQVKLCLNTVPGDGAGGGGTVRNSRLKR